MLIRSKLNPSRSNPRERPAIQYWFAETDTGVADVRQGDTVVASRRPTHTQRPTRLVIARIRGDVRGRLVIARAKLNGGSRYEIAELPPKYNGARARIVGYFCHGVPPEETV